MIILITMQHEVLHWCLLQTSFGLFTCPIDPQSLLQGAEAGSLIRIISISVTVIQGLISDLISLHQFEYKYFHTIRDVTGHLPFSSRWSHWGQFWLSLHQDHLNFRLVSLLQVFPCNAIKKKPKYELFGKCSVATAVT